MTTYDRTLLAYHEAGHAVAGLIVGRPFTDVSVAPEPICRFSDVGDELEPLIDAGQFFWADVVGPFVDKVILTAVAGYAAEVIFLHPIDWVTFASESDYDQVDLLLDKVGIGCCAEFPPETRDADIRAYLDRAIDLLSVAEHRARVEAVAEALLAQDTLTFTEVLTLAAYNATFSEWNVPVITGM